MTRQEAIELLSSDVFKLCIVQLCDPLFEDCYEALCMAIEALEQEVKREKWIVYPLMDEGRVELECPICGDTFIRAVNYKPHFCENCGADMRGDEQ